MNNQTMWNIRDARGLSAGEKALLFVVESRGTSIASRKTLAQDMGVSVNTYDSYRTSLINKGLLRPTLRTGGTTIYVVDADVLSTYLPITDSGEGDTPESMAGDSQNPGGGHPRSLGTKKNIKKNVKNNLEEEQASCASAPDEGLPDESSPVKEMVVAEPSDACDADAPLAPSGLTRITRESIIKNLLVNGKKIAPDKVSVGRPLEPALSARAATVADNIRRSNPGMSELEVQKYVDTYERNQERWATQRALNDARAVARAARKAKEEEEAPDW